MVSVPAFDVLHYDPQIFGGELPKNLSPFLSQFFAYPFLWYFAVGFLLSTNLLAFPTMVRPRLGRVPSNHYWTTGGAIIAILLLITNLREPSDSVYVLNKISIPKSTPAKTLDVLKLAFVGNSIIFYNDAPLLLENMMKEQRVSSIVQDSCLAGGGSLFSLMVGTGYKGTCMKKMTAPTTGKRSTKILLQKEQWDYIIMNDQTQSPTRPELKERTVKILKEEYLPLIQDTGATVIFLMTSAYQRENVNFSQGLGTFDEFTELLKQGYNEYVAIFPKAKIAPMGLAYQYAKRNDEKLFNKLYASDHYHPSILGSYLEACVLYCTILEERPPVYNKKWWDNPRYKHLADMPLPSDEEADQLQEIAWKVCNAHEGINIAA